MRVSMIDPSLFTLPYDQGLAKGLMDNGHEVTLFARRPGPDDSTLRDVVLVESFYRFAGRREIAALPQKLRLGVKGLDHVWSMLRLTRLLGGSVPMSSISNGCRCRWWTAICWRGCGKSRRWC